MNFKKVRRGKRTNINGFAFGLIFSVASFFALAFLGALILSKMKNPLGSIGMFAFAILLLSGALSGFCTSKYKGEGGIVPTVFSSCVFVAVLLICGLIINGGKLPVLTLINLLSYIMLAVFFAIIAKKRRRRRR